MILYMPSRTDTAGHTKGLWLPSHGPGGGEVPVRCLDEVANYEGYTIKLDIKKDTLNGADALKWNTHFISINFTYLTQRIVLTRTVYTLYYHATISENTFDFGNARLAVRARGTLQNSIIYTYYIIQLIVIEGNCKRLIIQKEN